MSPFNPTWRLMVSRQGLHAQRNAREWSLGNNPNDDPLWPQPGLIVPFDFAQLAAIRAAGPTFRQRYEKSKRHRHKNPKSQGLKYMKPKNEIFALTEIGAATDKAGNEDFAAAAEIHVGSDNWKLIAVADGISNGQIWPERGARIAVLSCLRVLATAARRGDMAAESVIGELVAELTDQLHRDRAHLQTLNAIPAEWAPDYYQQRSQIDRCWYGTTLLFAVMGRHGALIGWSGDGYIELTAEKQDGSEHAHVLLPCDDNTPLSEFVSLGVRAGDFQIRQVHFSPDTKAVRVSLASDGVGRNLRPRGCPAISLNALAQCADPGSEFRAHFSYCPEFVDNISWASARQVMQLPS